ncbi:BamA/TamA family outer membrane protein [Stenotrophomonas sp.]|uniref:BamA/TamA family outer membrane protein n=1 Tax=Stenotrophomonas sp. TaxID=69392 RepID=UPI00289E9EDB|nr:BamA/TamA family outer membrane protein [Stenotrophomonas sp.]
MHLNVPALLILGMALLQVPIACAQPADTAREPAGMFRDSEDGRFDMSRWLLDHRGFLPVPIIITDPALGNGGGLALAFFQRPQGSSPAGGATVTRPNLYGAGGARTSNGSEFYGVGASLHFDDDRWRYRGGVAKASINLGYHTPGRRLPPLEIDYNVDGVVSFQQGFRRLGARDLYVGLAWIYMDMDIGFDIASDRDNFTPRELGTKSSGLGLSLEYDSRDNTFSPSTGWLGMIEGNAYLPGIGSDSAFQSYRGHAYGYWPLGKAFVLGGRVDARWANGDIPFYRLPYIDLRGIGSARYQDTRAAVLETELRWNTTARWALVGFFGAGRTWGRHNSFGDASDEVAKGVGVRYLIARQLGMHVGVDYAWGPEDETFYIQVGSPWR